MKVRTLEGRYILKRMHTAEELQELGEAFSKAHEEFISFERWYMVERITEELEHMAEELGWVTNRRYSLRWDEFPSKVSIDVRAADPDVLLDRVLNQLSGEELRKASRVRDLAWEFIRDGFRSENYYAIEHMKRILRIIDRIEEVVRDIKRKDERSLEGVLERYVEYYTSAEYFIEVSGMNQWYDKSGELIVY